MHFVISEPGNYRQARVWASSAQQLLFEVLDRRRLRPDGTVEPVKITLSGHPHCAASRPRRAGRPWCCKITLSGHPRCASGWLIGLPEDVEEGVVEFWSRLPRATPGRCNSARGRLSDTSPARGAREDEEMLIVTSASYRRGFTGHDHLLSDDDFSPLLGRLFSSESSAQRAAEKLRRSSAPVSLCFEPAPRHWHDAGRESVTRIVVSWCGSPHDGHYDCEVWADAEPLDSDGYFPVEVGRYERHSAPSLRRALEREFPAAKIVGL